MTGKEMRELDGFLIKLSHLQGEGKKNLSSICNFMIPIFIYIQSINEREREREREREKKKNSYHHVKQCVDFFFGGG